MSLLARSAFQMATSATGSGVGVSLGTMRSSPLSRYFEISAGRLLGLDDSLENKRDDLTAYKQEQGLTCDGSPLSEEEADLIAMFRAPSVA